MRRAKQMGGLLVHLGLWSCCSNGADVFTVKPLPPLLAANEMEGPSDVAALQAWQAHMVSGNGRIFDGAVIDLGFRYQALMPTRLVAGNYAAQTAVARAVAAGGKTANFQIVNMSSLPLDWQDEAAFATIVRNLETAAELVAQAHMRGFLLENQMYGRSVFSVSAQEASLEGFVFAAREALVRERGAAVGAALLRGFPGVEIMFSWAYAEMFRGLCFEGGKLATHPYALYPAFLEGIQQAVKQAGTGAKVIDGFLPAYPARRPQDFAVFRNLVHADRKGLVQGWQPQIVTHWDDLGDARGPVQWPDTFTLKCDPETAARLGVPLPAAFGIMVDYDVDAFPRALSPALPRYSVDALAPAIQAAVHASDTYVWLYSSAGAWFAPGSGVDPKVLAAVAEARQRLTADPLGEFP